MARSRSLTFLAGGSAIAVSTVALAGCGGGAAAAASPATSTSTSAAATSKHASGTVGAANSSLGSILVNSTGRTLYLFKADSATKSACSGACATAWPPLLATGTPTAGAGVTVAKLGTITRSDGTRQVTYNGHPLYLYVGDKQPGDVNGQGSTAFGAGWFVLAPSGNEISAQPSSSATTTSGGGGVPSY